MLRLMLSLVAALLLAVAAVFLLAIVVLTVGYTVKSIKNELKGGRHNDSNPKP